MIREEADERRELIALRAEKGASPSFPPRGGKSGGDARESQLKKSERFPAQENKREKSEGLSEEAKIPADSASLPDPNREIKITLNPIIKSI